MGVSAHFIDRGKIPCLPGEDSYYISLKDEFGYLDIKYDNRQSTSISYGGVPLSVDQQVCHEQVLDIFFTSILLMM